MLWCLSFSGSLRSLRSRYSLLWLRSSSGAPRFDSRSRPGLLELRRLLPERSLLPLRSRSRSSFGASDPVIRSARAGLMRSLPGSLAVSCRAGGSPGGGGGIGNDGVGGPELGVSGPMPELILPRPRTLTLSGVFCCPACCSMVLIPASCRLPPRAARSVADAGPVGAANPFGPG